MARACTSASSDPRAGRGARRREPLDARQGGAGEYGVGLELWNPAEYEHAPAFAAGAGDADYEEAAALLLQEWRMTDDDLAGFKLLARVCARLNADPRLELPRTADFVVFAIDPEIPDQAHIERHLRACIPRDIFKRLKKRGLFHVEP